MIRGGGLTRRNRGETLNRTWPERRGRPDVVRSFPHIPFRRAAAATVRHSRVALCVPVHGPPCVKLPVIAEPRQPNVVRLLTADRLGAFPDIEIPDQHVRPASAVCAMKATVPWAWRSYFVFLFSPAPNQWLTNSIDVGRATPGREQTGTRNYPTSVSFGLVLSVVSSCCHCSGPANPYPGDHRDAVAFARTGRPSEWPSERVR